MLWVACDNDLGDKGGGGGGQASGSREGLSFSIRRELLKPTCLLSEGPRAQPRRSCPTSRLPVLPCSWLSLSSVCPQEFP